MNAEALDHTRSTQTIDSPQSGELWQSLRTRACGMLSDETLVRRTRAGDCPAFTALITRYRDRLYAMALRSLGNEQEAGDALCEMAVSAFKDVGSFRASSDPGAWLHLHGLCAVVKRMNIAPGTYTMRVLPPAETQSER